MGIKQIFKNTVEKFSSFWTRPQDVDLSKTRTTSVATKREMKGGLAANEALLKGLYTGSTQEMALSSYLSDGMVDVPKNLTGIPGVIPDEGQDNRLIKELMPLIIDELPVLIVTMLTQGTAWRWARWSDKLHKLTWEVIPDRSITSIIIELDTGEITEIWTNEQLEYNKGEKNVAISTRKRHITKDLITEEWTGERNEIKQYKNAFGFLPIPFGYRCYEGDWRGNSVYARVLRWMKSIHDIAFKRAEVLTEFEAKVIQTVKNVQTWLRNNTDEINKSPDVEIDVFERKFVINGEGEDTKYLYLPTDATAQHTAAIQDSELKVIKGSGTPELFFGALATGNHASTEAQTHLVLEHIKGIRRDLTKGAIQLVNQSLKILAFMRFTQPPQVSVQWGNLSMLSVSQKAQVMSAYASAIVPLLGNGAISKEGAFYLTKELFPEFPADTPDYFMAGLDEMLVNHSSKVGQPAFDGGVY